MSVLISLQLYKSKPLLNLPIDGETYLKTYKGLPLIKLHMNGEVVTSPGIGRIHEFLQDRYQISEDIFSVFLLAAYYAYKRLSVV